MNFVNKHWTTKLYIPVHPCPNQYIADVWYVLVKTRDVPHFEKSHSISVKHSCSQVLLFVHLNLLTVPHAP